MNKGWPYGNDLFYYDEEVPHPPIDIDNISLINYTCDTDKVVHDFDAETARYVRIYVTRVDKSVHDTPMWFVYLKEFEVSYIA